MAPGGSTFTKSVLLPITLRRLGIVPLLHLCRYEAGENQATAQVCGGRYQEHHPPGVQGALQHLKKINRASHLLVDWVGLDFGCSTNGNVAEAARQDDGTPKSKSTQPRSTSRWADGTPCTCTTISTSPAVATRTRRPSRASSRPPPLQSRS